MKSTSRIDNVAGLTRQVNRKPWLIGIASCCVLLLVAVVNVARVGPSLASAQERERGSAEAERGGRESAEGKAQRRSPKAEAGRRRSPEADAGARRSPEADLRRGRSPERDSGRRSPDGGALRGFKPRTEREAALYQMIVQLQREVAALRRDVQTTRGTRDRDGERTQRDGGRREGDRGDGERRDGERSDRDPRDGERVPRRVDGPSDLAAGWERTKTGKVFKAYDKNGDQFVGLEEWLAMTNGNISDARRKLQTERFAETNPGQDNKLSPSEFIYWYTKGRFANLRDRPTPRRSDSDRPRDVEDAPRRRPAERDAPRRSPEGGRSSDSLLLHGWGILPQYCFVDGSNTSLPTTRRWCSSPAAGSHLAAVDRRPSHKNLLSCWFASKLAASVTSTIRPSLLRRMPLA